MVRTTTGKWVALPSCKTYLIQPCFTSCYYLNSYSHKHVYLVLPFLDTNKFMLSLIEWNESYQAQRFLPHSTARSHLWQEKKRTNGPQKWKSDLVSKPEPFSLIFYFLLPSFFPLGTKDWMDGPWIHVHRPTLTRELNRTWQTEPNSVFCSMLAWCPSFPGNTSLPAVELCLPPFFPN